MTAAADPRPVIVIDHAQAATVLLDPVRLRLVEELAEPASAPMLARRLGLPRQRIGYHLRALEKAGLIRLVAERRKRNCTERLLQACALAYALSPATLGGLGNVSDAHRDRFSWSSLVALATRMLRDLGRLQRQADQAGASLQTLTIEAEVRFGSVSDQLAFARELQLEVARLAAKYDDPDAPQDRACRVFAGSYPETI